ncbi:hypothetical protein [Spirillospora sp. NBC_01491]|uniref:hypothetical protein n=1 Tax=Spirillospora sp. NBC_01491 TaxID=2976007 RepID=UPI002E322C5A|nr:hypothetical protein [Spirillospora sp. NBC_01491]
MLWKPRIVTSVAGAAAFAVTACLVAGTRPAAADIGAEMRFSCTTSSGTQDVTLHVGAIAPAAGTVGEPLQVGTVSLSLDVPASLLSAVLGSPSRGSSSTPIDQDAAVGEIGGSAQLDVRVEQGGRTLRAGWPTFALAAQSARSDGAGVTRLVGTGIAPPLVPQTEGRLKWVSGGLVLNLADVAEGQGAARRPLRCAPEKTATLGTVAVRRPPRAITPGTGTAPAGTAGGQPRAAAPDTRCTKIPSSDEDPEYDINKDPELYKIYQDPPLPGEPGQIPALPKSAGLPLCIRNAGFANIKKAGNAVPVAAETLLRRSTGGYSSIPLNYFQQWGYVEAKPAASTATVLGFGFMPTTATAVTEQVRAPASGPGETIKRRTGNFRLDFFPNTVTPPLAPDVEAWIRTYVAMKVGNVSVNGVSLKLGEKCSSERTLLSLYSFMGNANTGAIRPDNGQTLSGKLTIPKFANCGVDEDLSPLLNASISGPGNYVKVESGKWCNTNSLDCDTVSREPETWSVSPGGDVTATAKPFVVKSGEEGNELRCDSAALKFHLDARRWKERFMLSKMTPRFSNCKAVSAAGSIPVEMTASPLYMNGLPMAADGGIQMEVNGVLINAAVNAPSGRCSIRIGSYYYGDGVTEMATGLRGGYDNASHTLAVGSPAASTYVTPASTCTDVPGFTSYGTAEIPTTNFVFSPAQKFTKP